MRNNLWTRAGLSWWELLRRISREVGADQVFGRAAELAFYFLFGLFPLLLFLTSVFAHVMGERADLRADLFAYLERVIPGPRALDLVKGTLGGIIDQRGLHFSVGLVFSLIASAQAMVAVGRVLDATYDVEKRRPFLLAQLIGVALTLAFSALSFAALVLLFWGGSIARLLAGRLAFGGSYLVEAWSWLQWPVGLLFVLAAFELIYNFAPSAWNRRLSFWSSPGAAVAVGLWLSASFGLKAYLQHFDAYAWAYGSLGALIALMMWFYLTGFAILVGGVINHEIERALKEGRPRPPRRRWRLRRKR
ncbi:MAG TPA: YihY/virulence factor BrkB family protein [Thermoanaerobaculia bacterium]|nr:YihY/virulence factor BrkB family protein [Thermoanaerobaculia bacterium]